MKMIFTPFIKLYQFFSSSTAPRCKYYPTCSNYALTAIKRHGAKGVVMATWRILRCNPWSFGGVDYVDEEIDCADAVQARKNQLVGAN
jgi:putative membrane protein insertion efficiency factor